VRSKIKIRPSGAKAKDVGPFSPAPTIWVVEKPVGGAATAYSENKKRPPMNNRRTIIVLSKILKKLENSMYALWVGRVNYTL
jgi:hypothetical protein